MRRRIRGEGEERGRCGEWFEALRERKGVVVRKEEEKRMKRETSRGREIRPLSESSGM